MISKQQVKHIRSLQQKKFRDLHEEYIVEGQHIVYEALGMVPDAVQMLIYTTKTLPHISNRLKFVQGRSYCVSSKEFRQMSSQKTPQELMAVMKISRHLPPSDPGDQLIIALDSIRDPGNMGTLIRLADWFGISDLVCSEDTVDHFNPKVVQASMGALFRVRVSYTDLPTFLTGLKAKYGIHVYGTDMNGNNVFETSMKSPGVLVMGNEASGISGKILELTSENLAIPNYSASKEKTESLNVAVAAAIFCAEFRRQNN